MFSKYILEKLASMLPKKHIRIVQALQVCWGQFYYALCWSKPMLHLLQQQVTVASVALVQILRFWGARPDAWDDWLPPFACLVVHWIKILVLSLKYP